MTSSLCVEGVGEHAELVVAVLVGADREVLGCLHLRSRAGERGDAARDAPANDEREQDGEDQDRDREADAEADRRARRLHFPGRGAGEVVGGDGRQLIYVPMDNTKTAMPAAATAIVPDLVSPTVNATEETVRKGRQGRPDGREETSR